MNRFYTLTINLIFLVLLSKAQPGSLDTTFITDFDFKNSEFINCVGVQSDGKIILGGTFKDPIFNPPKTANILRLNFDGTLDLDFKTGQGFDNSVNAMAVQEDGKILVGGGFKRFNNKMCPPIVRLNKDGSFDSTFTAPVMYANVLEIKILKDHKILVGSPNLLIRLNSNGSLDPTFSYTGPVSFNSIGGICEQLDGKILIGGYFPLNPDPFSRKLLFRLNKDGSLDYYFDPGKNLEITGYIYDIYLQKDGKFLIGGYGIHSFKNDKISNIARFNPDGSWDSTFSLATGFEKNAAISDKYVNTITTQKDGKIIIGGVFDNYQGVRNRNIARLNTDGSLDTTFKTREGFDKEITRLDLYNDDKLIVTGKFNNFNSVLANRIVRLNTKYPDTKSGREPNITSVYPNPNNGNFVIQNSGRLGLITIYDMLGKDIMKVNALSNFVNIDISDKSNGLYFIRLVTEDKNKTVKVLKTN